MRIAILSWESLYSIAVGGVASHVSELATALVDKGHHVHVFTRRAPGQLAHDCIDGVHYHRCKYVSHHDFVDDINNMCRSFVDRFFAVEDFVGHFDVVHAHDWLAANAMIWIKQGRGHRTVLTIHSTEYARCGNAVMNGRSVRVRDQERAGTYWADRVIAISNATKDELSRMYDLPDWKTSVIYNGVRSERFDVGTDPGQDKRQYQIAPLDPTVLFCGRLTWQKGPDLLVEAVPRILHTQPSAKFVFVGDGEMRAGLEAHVRHLGSSNAVRFVGYRNGNDLVHLFKMVDVVCVPSRNEPFGIVVLEAWSAGKPVIVTQTGGPKEYVWHDVNGLMIYPHADSVLWGVNAIFSDFDRARRMGHNGKIAVAERFGWDAIANQTIEVYCQACPESKAVASDMESYAEKDADMVPSGVPRLYKRRGNRFGSGAVDQRHDGLVKLCARLSFCIEHPGNKDLNGLNAFRESLKRQGLTPFQEGADLSVDGDWKSVLAALVQCHRHAYRPNINDLDRLKIRRQVQKQMDISSQA